MNLKKNNTEKKSTEKKYWYGIRQKLTGLTIYPIIVLAVAICIYSGITIKNVMAVEIKNELRIAACTMRNHYEANSEDDYSLQDNSLYKGNDIISDNDKLDSLKNDLDVEFTVFYGDTRIATTLINTDGTRMVGTKASDAVIDAVLHNGEEYFSKDIKIGGIDYYGYYIPLTQPSTGKVIGMIFTGTTCERVADQLRSVIFGIMFITLFFAILVFLIAFYFCSVIAKVIKELASKMNQVASGELDVIISDKYLSFKDELGDLSRDIDSTCKRLKEIIGGISNITNILNEKGKSLAQVTKVSSNTADEISNMVDEISKSIVSQAESTETAAKNVDHIKKEVSNIVDKTEMVSKASERIKQSSTTTMGIIEELKNDSNKTSDVIGNVGIQVAETNDSVTEIHKSTDAINDIASQTKLLSLNASIEAARAGESGKGFAVVASEIQTLAVQSSESANCIEKTIQSLIEKSTKTVEEMSTLNEEIIKQKNSLDSTIDNYDRLNKEIDHTAESIQFITTATESLLKAEKEIEEIVENLSAISEENAAATQEMTASVQGLNTNINEIANSSDDIKNISDELMEKVSYFK